MVKDQDINLIVVEDDPFARYWMTLLLARDLRVRVLDDLFNLGDLEARLHKANQSNKEKNVDLVLIDADSPPKLTGQEGDRSGYSRRAEVKPKAGWMEEYLKQPMGEKKPRVIFTYQHLELKQLFPFLEHPLVRGFLKKDEIDNSIAWAVVEAAKGNWVATRSVVDAVEAAGRLLPRPAVELDGRNTGADFNDIQWRRARLVLICSMGRSDVADEFSLALGSSYNLASQLYTKVGVDDLLEGHKDPREALGGDPELMALFDRTMAARLKHIDKAGKPKKGERDLNVEALAFHMLTKPVIHRL